MRAPLLLACAALVACGEPCAVSVGNGIWLCGPERADLEVLSGDGTPWVEGRVSGRSSLLLLDTGAAATVISAELLGVADGDGVWLDDLCLGEMCFSAFRIWARNTNFSSAEPGKLAGVVGVDLLGGMQVELDRGQRVKLGVGLAPCRGEHGRPFLPVRAAGVELEPVLLDTGASWTMLGPEASERLEDELAEDLAAASFCDIEGCRDDQAFTSTLRSYCLGAACEADVPVKFPTWDAVGATWLTRRRVFVDLAESSLVVCDEE